MTYGGTRDGAVVLTLTADESKRFEAGEEIVKVTGYAKGKVTIRVRKEERPWTEAEWKALGGETPWPGGMVGKGVPKFNAANVAQVEASNRKAARR